MYIMTKYIKLTLVALTCSLIAAIYPLGNISADDHKQETRSLSTFHTITVKGAIEIAIKIGDTQSLKVAAQDFELEDIKTTVKDGVLHIDTHQEKSFWGTSRNNGKITVTITMVDFKAINVKGAVSGDISNIKKGETIDIYIAGAADLELDGTCGTLTVNMKGAGDIDAENLKCKAAEVTIAGAGNTRIYTTESVNALVKGVGNINILGNPKKVVKQVKGIGSINVEK